MSNIIDKEIRSIVSEALAQTNIHIAMLSDKISELEALTENPKPKSLQALIDKCRDRQIDDLEKKVNALYTQAPDA